MAKHALQLDHSLPGTLETVYSSILDMRHFGYHHPYMKEVTLLNSTPEYTEYYVKEMVWIFGFIPQWPRYTTRVFERERNRHIQYTSAVNGNVDLSIDFFFDPGSQSTRISENVSLHGNGFICRVLLGLISRSHPALFKSICEQQSVSAGKQ